jgi:hypothetical protein
VTKPVAHEELEEAMKKAFKAHDEINRRAYGIPVGGNIENLMINMK